MKVICIANRRGGSGKTVTAHAIGAGLAQRGYRVLFLDLDSQCNLSYDLGISGNRYSAMDILTGSAEIGSVIQHLEKWDAIPAAPALSAADLLISGSGKEFILKDALRQQAPNYDYCVADTPPSLDTVTVNALTASDGVVIPAQPEIHSIQGLGLLYDTITQIRKRSNPGLKVYGILITRYTGRACLSKDMKNNLEGVAAQLGTKVYDNPIRECISIKEAEFFQQDIFSYAPRSNAAKDYGELINNIIEETERR